MADPTPQHIQYLQANPNTAAQFDEVYGEGSAAKFLSAETGNQNQPVTTDQPVASNAAAPAGQPTDAPQEAPAQEGSGFIEKAGKVAGDIIDSLPEVPEQVIGGAAAALGETMKASNHAAQWVEKNVPDWLLLGDQEFRDKFHGSYEEGADKLATSVAPSEHVTANIVRGGSQFITGLIGAGKFTEGIGLVKPVAGAAKWAYEAAKGALAGFTVFDPHAERLSNFIQDHPSIANPVNELLAAKPDDTEVEGRLKNAIEGIGMDVLAQPFIWAVKALRAAKNGDAAGAVTAAKEAEATMPKQVDEMTEPQVPGIEPTKVEQPAAPKPVNDKPVAVEQTNADGQQEMFNASETGPKSNKSSTNPLDLIVDKKALNDLDIMKARENGYRGGGIDINWDYVNTPQEAKGLLNAISVVYKEKRDLMIEGDHGSTVKSQAQVMDEAKDLLGEMGVQDTDLGLARLSSTFGDVRDLDATVTAHRMMLGNLTKTVEELGRVAGDPFNNADLMLKWQKKYPTPELLNEALERHTELLVNYALTYKGVQTNIARAMKSMGYLGIGNADAVIKGLKSADGNGAKALAQQIIAATKGGRTLTPGQMVRIAQGNRFMKGLGIFNEYYINSLLSGTKTQFVQAMSSAAMTAYRPLEDAFAGVISANPELIKEAGRRYVGITLGVKDGLNTFLHALVNDPKQLGKDAWKLMTSDEVPSIDPNLKAEHGVQQNISSAAMNIGGPMGQAIDYLGTLIRTPTRMMATTDSVFKSLNYRGFMYAKAIREAEAAAASQGLKGPAKAKFIGQQVSDAMDKAYDQREFIDVADPVTGMGKSIPNPNFGKATNVEGLQYGKEITFTQDLKYGIGKGLSELTTKHPALKVIVPFIKTPTNILRFVWQRTPLINFAQKQFAEDFRAGGERRAQAVAKMTIGTSLYVTGASLAMEGKIIGALPNDPDLRRAAKENGVQPYSIVINNEDGTKTYIPYNRADPFGMFLGLAADATRIVGDMPNEDAEQFAGAAVTALTQNLSSKTYLQGMINLSNAISDGDRYGPAFIRNLLSPLVPGAVNSFNGDPIMRETRTIADTWLNKLPGMSEGLAPLRDNLGKPFDKPGGWPSSAINPFAFTTSPNDTVREEMARLAAGEGKVKFTLPPDKKGTLDLRSDKYKGDDGQTAYDRLVAARGTTTIGGKTLEESLKELIASDKYKAAPDPGSLYGESFKVDQIKKRIQEYDNKAWLMMLHSKDAAMQRLYADFRTDSKQSMKAKSKGEQEMIDLSNQ